MLPARSKRLARRRATQRVRLGSARVSRARDGVPPSRTFCVRYQCPRLSLQGKTVSARRRNQHAGRVRYPKQTKLSYFAYKFPPTPRVGLVWPRPHRPALILLFAKKFFRSPRRTNEVNRTNILAPGFALFPPSLPNFFGNWSNGKSYPVTAAQLLPILTGFLAPIHFSKLAKN